LKKNNIQLRIGIVLLSIVVLSLIIGYLINGINIEINLEHRLEASSKRFLLGTDELGRDLLSCIIYGAFLSLLTATIVVTISSVFGSSIGMISALSGGIIDTISMRIVDIILSFPGILLAIALVSFFNQGFWAIVFALTFSSWVGYARIVRSEALKHKNSLFIISAKSYNSSFFRIVFSHLLPLSLPLIIVQASLSVSGIILSESSLNFLGIGLKPDIPTLGQLIDSGRGHIFDRSEMIIYPGIILFLIIISFIFIGEGLRKRFEIDL